MYRKKTHIHFIGIGGIGMSGIAKILIKQGYEVSGCDLDPDQASLSDLKDAGCHIAQGNNTLHCKNSSIDIVVYSSAIQKNDPEIIYAQQRSIPTIPRALMLAELMRTKFSIAISGAHGKTTTTSLISHVLIEAQQDPTIIIGGHLKNISTNARWGAGEFLVAEADESDRSLVRLYPTLAVVTNIDLEHIDTYKNLHDIKDTFKQFLGNLPFYGKAFVCGDDPHIQSIIEDLKHIKIIQYGITHQTNFYATNIQLESHYSTAKVWFKEKCLGTLTIPMPGIHNVYNALACVAVTNELGISFERCAQALATFGGIDRRFTFKGTFQDAEVFDDYGHHPTEIKHTLLVARKRAANRLVVAFQPHRYSRTAGLWHEFIEVFKTYPVDHLIITDIYAASEQALEGITSQRLVQELQASCPQLTISYIPYDHDFKQLKSYCSEVVNPGDLLLTLGAGKMNKLAEILCKRN